MEKTILPSPHPGVTEEALRELDDALATLSDEEKAEGHPDPGTLFDGAPTAAADFAGKVEAVRKRAEELARRKQT